ncbi:hypothetical protein FALBO_9651 [Fusarium albosuccineum]|uniref:Chromo domain-containing protein n=1 Tax=Fusarium albosuccineum TaxID=1237068 RepID=A0A8H4L7E0_9HYPO|nr:hypothetical protein FALBO_9651 [Fusarium albosuccineum]
MEELSPGSTGQDQLDTASVASTIETELDSDEEWTVSDVLAECQLNGELQYLIKWEGYELFDASWEPKENLNDELLKFWEETKQQADYERTANLAIGAWRQASIERLKGKLARHEDRNRKRVERGLEPTEYGATLDEHMAFLDQYPKGEAPNESGALYSPSDISDQKNDTNMANLPNFPLKLEQSKLSKSPDKEPLQKSSRRSSTASIQDKPPRPTSSTAAHKEAPRRQSSSDPKRLDGSRQQVARTSNSLLLSKFGRPKPLKRISSDINNSQATSKTATQSSPSFTGNVFAGGKTRKKRSTLLDAAKNPTKTAKMFNHRQGRLVEKGQRDREGIVAPSKRPSSLISLNPAEKRAIRQNPSTSISSPDSIEESEATLSNHNTDVARQEVNSPASDQDPPKPKKKKSISWGPVEEATIPFVEEPMELDHEDSLFIPEPLPKPTIRGMDISKDSKTTVTALKQNLSSRRVRWAEETSADGGAVHQTGRGVTMKIQFGPEAQKTLSVMFEGLSIETGQPWLVVLEKEETLVFTHTCMMADFRDHTTAICEEQLGSGPVTGTTNQNRLIAASNWLWLRSVAVLFYRPEVCVLIHASGNKAGSKDGQSTDSDATGPLLTYILFRPPAQFRTSSLAPVSVPGGIRDGDVLPRMGATVMHRVFELHYERLLPENALNSPSKHTFFLAFPQDADLEARLLCRWLRSCNPECRVLSSLFPGHWRSFLKMDLGVVIIHEDAMWSVRHFPDLHFLLHASSSNFQFWLFSQSLQSSALYPSVNQRPRIGDVHFQSICESRKVIMITPSFLVSQPQQVWSLLSWFYKIWNLDNDAIRLVVCAEFDSWLHELVIEKHDKWVHGRNKTSAKRQRLEAAQKEGVEALYKAWLIVGELIEASSGEHSAFIFAPESIEGNDEQSLVNWFGWWSIMNMDRFRSFSILGSNGADPKRLARHLKRPKYLASVFVSPDDVYAMLDRKESEKDQVPDQLGAEPTARLQLVIGDDAASLKNFLTRLEDKSKETEWSPQMLYKYPISYWNSGMAYDFADYHNNFATYSKYLKFVEDHIFDPKLSAHYHNTGIAFCYTTEGTWDPDGNPGTLNKTRRPWIMIYRPVEPHRKPWQTTELFIWDSTRRGNTNEGMHAYEGDLIEAQRQMIRAVRQHFGSTLPLEKVWVGGLDGKPNDLTEPIDITLHQLQRLMQNLKTCVPAPEHKVAFGGWKRVEPGDAPACSRPPSTEPMDLDTPEDPGDTGTEGLKMVFHPPRGKPMGRPTNCKNRLYQHTLREVDRGQPRESMEYKFRPTMDWYRQQVEEGRGFEHIRVTTWEAIFEKYKIEDPPRD